VEVLVKFVEGPDAGRYLLSYDPDAYDGRGEVITTSDPERAQRFADHVAAWEEWKRPSTVHPIRLTDGKPNRPMTAWTVTIEPYVSG
jgi:hypothetical protein